jgi:hypothetical protein
MTALPPATSTGAVTLLDHSRDFAAAGHWAQCARGS